MWVFNVFFACYPSFIFVFYDIMFCVLCCLQLCFFDILLWYFCLFIYCLVLSNLTVIEVCQVLLLHISVISHGFVPYRFIFVLFWQLQYCVSLTHKWEKEDSLINRHKANGRGMLLALYLYDYPINCLLSFLFYYFVFVLFCFYLKFYCYFNLAVTLIKFTKSAKI